MADLAKVKPDELGIKYPYVGPGRALINETGIIPKPSETLVSQPPTVQLPSAEEVGAGIPRGVGRWVSGMNETVRNTSPVREIYDLAGGVSGLLRGAAPVAQATPVGTETPRTYVPPEPDFVTLKDGTKMVTQNKLDDVHLQIALADAQARSEGRPDTKAVNAQGMKWLTDNLSPGAGGARREMINGNAATSFGGGIAPKTTVQPGYAPQLKTPFDNPKAFATITGYRGDNPIYSSGAAEMTAANAGIAEYNKAAVDKFGAENTLYSTVTGGVPLQQAQALLAGTSAAEMPGENKSQQGFRSAQSKEALANASLLSAKAAVAGDPEPPKPHFGEIESIGQGGMTKTPYVSYVDREGNLQVKTQQGAQGSFAAVAASLTPEQKSIAAKHMKKGQTQEEQTSIFTKVKNGELK